MQNFGTNHEILLPVYTTGPQCITSPLLVCFLDYETGGNLALIFDTT